ncbi:MAG: helix-turn-helix domain-containing protein, partial [Solirubrobacterales bacterium]
LMARAEEESDSGTVRLPPGRHGFSRDFVSESQRERLLNGVVEAVVAHGYNATTIAQLIEAAAVSRRTFYEHFADKEECFLAAYEMIGAHLAGALREAEGQPSWPARVRAELAALLGVFAADPTVARFVLLESLAAGGEVTARHRATLRCFAGRLRPEPPAAGAGALAEAREQALVGGISTLVARRLQAGEAARLEELLPDLHELVLTSYLGRGEGQRLARASAA